MTNIEPWLVSSLLGFILSVPWGIAVWLKWQTMKHGTIIPFGFLTCRYGAIVGFIINVMCIVIALLYAPYPKWWLILTCGLTHYFGVWIATLIERKLYCNNDLIERIVHNVSKHTKTLSSEDTATFMSIAVPNWWLKIMTLEWQQELSQRVLSIHVQNSKGEFMNNNIPSFEDFKIKIESLLGKTLTRPALDATEDFWNHWATISLLISRRSLSVFVDPLYLSQVYPQYTRYHSWKGAGIIAFLLGIISIWFIWQLGTVLFVAGIGLHYWGNRVKYIDAKDFADELMKDANLNPSDEGYAKLCINYIAGTIQLVSPSGTAHWPQYPSDVITGKQSFIST